MTLRSQGCEGPSRGYEGKNCPGAGTAGASFEGQVEISQADGRAQQSSPAKPSRCESRQGYAGAAGGSPDLKSALLSSSWAHEGVRPLTFFCNLHVVIRILVLCQVRTNGGPYAREEYRVCVHVCVCVDICPPRVTSLPK